MEKSINIEAIVVEFIPNAMSDHYDSGTFEIYDATIIQILSPVRYLNRNLTIFHDERVSLNSLWRNINQRICFSINESCLTGDCLVFAGAIEKLRSSP